MASFQQARKMQQDCFQTLGNMAKAMLEVVQNDPENCLRELHGLVNAGVMLYIFEDGRRVNFHTEYDQHPVWQNMDVWKLNIHRIINVKFAKAVENVEIQKLEREKAEKESGFFGGIAKIFSDDKPIQFELKGTLKINKSLAQQIVFNLHQDLIQYYISFNVSFENARTLVLHFLNKYELDQQRTHLLMHDLENAQRD